LLRLRQIISERPTVVHRHRSNLIFTLFLLGRYLLRKAVLIGIRASEKTGKMMNMDWKESIRNTFFSVHRSEWRKEMSVSLST
jgi:hypothetical protein